MCTVRMLAMYITIALCFQIFPMLKSGYRIPPPAGCPKLIYQLMIQCWLAVITYSFLREALASVIPSRLLDPSKLFVQ